MKKYDLSILIPARNEEFLYKTVEEILTNKRGNTEIIINLDGAWAYPAIPDHPDITIIYNNFSLGQRAGTNQAAKLSRAKYVMKCDAHLAFSEGFDVELLKEMKDDYTMVPRLYNLHVFDWQCDKCGNKWYQSPTPKYCRKEYEDDAKERNPLCDNTKDFTRILVWKPRWHKRTDAMVFDSDLHFQYWGEYRKRPEAQGNVIESFSLLGACWLVTRDKYWELEMCDERHGSWGQQGTEVACKTWLSGGKLVINKKAWYSHLFRTQGGDFAFPYPNPEDQIQKAREYSKDLWRNGRWEKAIHPLSWLVEKFWPVKGWNEADLAALKAMEPKQKSDQPTKGIIYYTDNQLNLKISVAVKKQILKARLPIVSTSLKPTNFGKNIVMETLTRGWYAYFKQILTALENSDADIIYFCEHDWLYHPSHFDFTPPDKRTFYYNWNWWRVRSSDGKAVHYDTQLVPGIVAYRELFLEYYRKIVKLLDEYIASGGTDIGKYAHEIGFEPATHNRIPELSGYQKEKFESAFPIIDIRHDNNLTQSKWTPDQFRSPKNARNWKETEEIEGWGKVKDNFIGLISSI